MRYFFFFFCIFRTTRAVVKASLIELKTLSIILIGRDGVAERRETRMDRSRKENIASRPVHVRPRGDKEVRLRWLGHVQRRPSDRIEGC